MYKFTILLFCGSSLFTVWLFVKKESLLLDLLFFKNWKRKRLRLKLSNERVRQVNFTGEGWRLKVDQLVQKLTSLLDENYYLASKKVLRAWWTQEREESLIEQWWEHPSLFVSHKSQVVSVADQSCGLNNKDLKTPDNKMELDLWQRVWLKE